MRPKENRGKTPAATRWARNRQSSLRGSFGQAPRRRLGPPRSLNSPHQVSPPAPLRATAARCGAGTTRRPLPAAGGTGVPPFTDSATRPPRATPPTAATQRGVRWEQGTAPPLGFRHLRRPGALQGHHGGPGATRSARPGGEQRGIGCSPPTTGRPPTTTQPREASESVRCVSRPRSRSDGRPGSGRSPHPSATPRAAHRREGGAWGPQAEREERSHSPGVPVPRLTRLRPGPGERDITTSIGYRHTRQSWGEEGAGETPGEDSDQRRTCFSLASTPPPPLPGNRQPDNPQGEKGTPDTRHGALRGWVCHGHGRVPAAGSARGRRPTPPPHAALGCQRPEVAPQPEPHLDAREPARRPRQTARASRRAKGGVGLGSASPPSPEPRQPAATRPKSLLQDDNRHIRTCQHLPGSKKYLFQETKITALAGGAEPQVTGTFWDPGPATGPKHLPITAKQPPTPPGSPRGPSGRPRDRPTDRPTDRGIAGWGGMAG